MPIFFFPEHIHIDVGLDKETRDLITRILDRDEERPKLGAAAAALDASSKGLQKIVDDSQPQK